MSKRRQAKPLSQPVALLAYLLITASLAQDIVSLIISYSRAHSTQVRTLMVSLCTIEASKPHFVQDTRIHVRVRPIAASEEGARSLPQNIIS